MPQQDILIPGTLHHAQGAEYLCGPACINIVLSLWDKHQTMDVIWSDVQANTGTQLRPPAAPWEEGSFDTQVCEPCGGGSYDCWFTTPEAMARTINDYSPESVRADYLSSQLVIERIADSLSATSPVPAPFTTQPALHWVVAIGYQLDGSGTAVVWNGQKITGLYVRDPIGPDQWPDTTQLITIAGLFEPIANTLLMSVECGPNQNLYPVVARDAGGSGGGGGGGGQGGGGGGETGVLDVVTRLWSTFLRFAIRPWRYFMPDRDPRNPGPPPPNRGGG